jgi:hypothetical protein
MEVTLVKTIHHIQPTLVPRICIAHHLNVPSLSGTWGKYAHLCASESAESKFYYAQNLFSDI